MASKIKQAINKMSLAEIEATEFMNFKCFYKIYNKVKHKVSFVEFIKFQTIHRLRGQKLRVKIDDNKSEHRLDN